MPQSQPPWVRRQRTKRRASPFGTHASKLPAAHAEDVIQRPTGDHTIKRQNQQRRDHAHQRCPGPFRRSTRLDGQGLEGIHRALPAAPTDQGFGEHDRQADHKNAHQVHHHESPAAVHAGHIGELPDIAQANSRTSRSQNKHPTAGPGAVYRNLIVRHVRLACSIEKRSRIVGDSPGRLKHSRHRAEPSL